MTNTVRIGGQELEVQGARTDGTLRSGDVVSLRMKQEPPFFSWFAPDPLEAAENVAQLFNPELLTIPDATRPDVRGWALIVEEIHGFERGDDVYVDVRLRVAGYDSRTPEEIPTEELEATLCFAQLVTVLSLVLASLVTIAYTVDAIRVAAVETGASFKSPFGFGLVDAVIAVAAAWVLVAWFKSKGVPRG